MTVSLNRIFVTFGSEVNPPFLFPVLVSKQKGDDEKSRSDFRERGRGGEECFWRTLTDLRSLDFDLKDLDIPKVFGSITVEG